MIPAQGYAATSSSSPLAPHNFERREPGPKDVVISIEYCGVCHSDVHQVRNEWQNSMYPMVPGHEIVGKITAVGDEVKKFQVGDQAGVGCLVDSCRNCRSCGEQLEQYCENGFVLTYNGYEKDGQTLTQGGYSNIIVVDEDFALKIKATSDLSAVAPLLCAGITTYSPLKHWQVGPGSKVGIIGLGGLGHMAIKLAHSLGAEVTLFTTSPNKAEDAKRLGATSVVISKDAAQMEQQAESLDLIINTVSASIDLNPYLDTLKRDGTMVLLGIPDKSPEVNAMGLIFKRRRIAGSLIGGLAETQEMLDYCAEKDITCDIEMIKMQDINEAYERMLKSDVKYRFVIDLETL